MGVGWALVLAAEGVNKAACDISPHFLGCIFLPWQTAHGSPAEDESRSPKNLDPPWDLVASQRHVNVALPRGPGPCGAWLSQAAPWCHRSGAPFFSELACPCTGLALTALRLRRPGVLFAVPQNRENSAIMTCFSKTASKCQKLVTKLCRRAA